MGVTALRKSRTLLIYICKHEWFLAFILIKARWKWTGSHFAKLDLVRKHNGRKYDVNLRF